jgi:hypothetical protein
MVKSNIGGACVIALPNDQTRNGLIPNAVIGMACFFTLTEISLMPISDFGEWDGLYYPAETTEYRRLQTNSAQLEIMKGCYFIAVDQGFRGRGIGRELLIAGATAFGQNFNTLPLVQPFTPNGLAFSKATFPLGPMIGRKSGY